MAVPEQEAQISGENIQSPEPENKASDSEKALIERLVEMSAVVKICGALSMKDVVGWNEDTGTVAIENADRRLEGRAVYDTLFLEAADYVLMQSLSGNTQKAVEMDALLKEAGKYAARYESEPKQQREGHAAEVSETEQTGGKREESLPDAEPEIQREKVTVAIETSIHFSEPEYGFVTDDSEGGDGIKYRLVTLDDEGYMIPYLPEHQFFTSEELIQEYIEAHAEEIEVISYDDMGYNLNIK